MRRSGMQSYLREIRSDHGPVGELSTCKSLESFGRLVSCLVFDEDLADSCRLPASTNWSGYLHLQDVAEFAALFLDIFTNFCGGLR
jgi:hypothetical protein